MKNLIKALLLFGPLLATTGCKKDKKEYPKDNFVIHGITEIDLGKQILSPMYFGIEEYSGLQERITLSVEGLPAGVLGAFKPSSGLGSFGTKLDLETQFGAVAGIYPIKIIGKSNSLTQIYELNLKLPTVSYTYVDGKRYSSVANVGASNGTLYCNAYAPGATYSIKCAVPENLVNEGDNMILIVDATAPPANGLSVELAVDYKVVYNQLAGSAVFAKITKTGSDYKFEIPEITLSNNTGGSFKVSGVFYSK